MKKIIITLVSLVFPIALSSSLVSCYSSNNYSDSSDGDLNDIINPVRGWPPIEDKYLSIWQWNLDNNSKKISNILFSITQTYNSGYMELFNKYYNSNFSKLNPNVPCDSMGVPLSSINKMVNSKIATKNTIQLYEAYTLRQYYIEMVINKLNTGSYWINEDEIVNIYAGYWYRGLAFYDWQKIWISTISENLEVAVNFNFYDYYHAAEDWNTSDQPDVDRVYDWKQVQTHKYENCDYTYKDTIQRNNKVINKNNGIFHQYVIINKVFYTFVDELYNKLFSINEEQ